MFQTQIPSSFRFDIRRSFAIAALALLASVSPAPAQQSDPAATELLKKVSGKFADVNRYAFTAGIEVARQNGEDPKVVIAKAEVKYALAPSGQSYINVKTANEKSDKSEYSAISNGRKSWTVVPDPSRYSERAADGKAGKDVAQGTFPELDKATPERFAREFVPVLARLEKTTEVAFLRGTVLTLLSEKDPKGRQTLLYLTLDPSSLTIVRATWVKSIESEGAKTLVRCDYVFKDFRLGEKVSDQEFSFTPSADSKRTDDLKIPGRTY